MDAGSLQEQLFNAIDVITEEKMKQLSFNYCIEGVITSSTQNEDGSYSFMYQDAELTAFSLSNVQYQQGDIVYVMAINGDLSKKKVILSSKSRNGQQYVDIAEELSKVNKTGINYVTNIESEFVLFSGTEEKQLVVSNNIIGDSYTQTYIRISADVTSALEPTVGGNYGISLVLRHEDDTIKEYALTLNEITGDAYNATGIKDTIEELYLGSVVKEVVSAKLFISGFPEQNYPNEYVRFRRVRIEFVSDSLVAIADKVSYKVEMFSTNGLIFKNGVVSTTILARVFQGTEDITDMIPEERFIWSKTAADGTTIENWRVGKTIQVDRSSVDNRATFSCKIIED